jgi:predicted transcriptional regulator
VKKKLIAIRIDEGQAKALAAISRREDRSVSWLIRKAVNEFLKKQK